MKPYQLNLECQKTVQKMNVSREPVGKPTVAKQWSRNIELSSPPNRSNMFSQITDFLFLNSDLTVHYLYYCADQPGHFTAQQCENQRGFHDIRGRYFAQYDLFISWRKVEPMKPLDNSLGLIISWRKVEPMKPLDNSLGLTDNNCEIDLLQGI